MVGRTKASLVQREVATRSVDGGIVKSGRGRPPPLQSSTIPAPCPYPSFRASDRRHWRGNPFPAPAGAESPSPPSAREVSALRADGGIVIDGRGRAPLLHTGFRRSFRRGRCPRSEASTLGVHRPAVFASYSGRTESSAPTHLLMYRVSVPCLSLWERWPSAARTERANH